MIVSMSDYGGLTRMDLDLSNEIFTACALDVACGDVQCACNNGDCACQSNCGNCSCCT